MSVIRIINGLRYDTDKATEVATDSWGYASDFDHWVETIYVTDRGNWFLVGSGGAMSRYAVAVEGGGRGGSRDNVRPMSPDQVRAWLEAHGMTDALEHYFGDDIADA